MRACIRRTFNRSPLLLSCYVPIGFTWFSLAVNCVMVELKLSWFNTVFVKGLLPFKYKRFQVLGHPRDVRCVNTHLLNVHELSSSVRSALWKTYGHVFSAVERGKQRRPIHNTQMPPQLARVLHLSINFVGFWPLFCHSSFCCNCVVIWEAGGRKWTRLVAILVQVRKNWIDYGILPSRLFNNLYETKMFLEIYDVKAIEITSYNECETSVSWFS